MLTSEFADSIWVKIHLNNNDNLIIGCVYRSPNSSPENNDNFLALLAHVADTDPSHLLILGDVNLPDINWNAMTTNHSNLMQVSNRFINLINDNYLYQHINFPTRYRLSQTPTQDDIILTNEPDMVTNISQEATLGKSDHLYLSFSFNCYKPPSQHSFKKYYYDRGDYPAFRQALDDYTWEPGNENQTPVDSMWQQLPSTITKARDAHIPHRTIRPKNAKKKPIWLNRMTRDKLKLKKQAWKKYQISQTNTDYNSYARARNQAKTVVRQAMKLHEKQIATNARDNPKAFWSYINSKSKTSTRIPDLAKNGSTATTDQDKANVLNTFFTSVFTDEALYYIAALPLQNFRSTLDTISFTPTTIEHFLAKLEPDKAAGPDEIPPRLLKEAAPNLAKPLSDLYTASMHTGKIPQDWRDGIITPIHKKGPRTIPGNYRPISSYFQGHGVHNPGTPTPNTY